MAYTEGGHDSKSYPWGTGKTRCSLNVSTSNISDTTTRVTLTGRTRSGDDAGQYYRMKDYSVTVQVGHAACNGAGASWHETVGIYDYAAWVGNITKSYDIPRGHSDVSMSCWTKYWGGGNANYGTSKNSGEVFLNATIPAKTHYTVSYNANGGSGAPGKQTKWYGENLTLSSTKPTRTGYTFNGWSGSDGKSYSAGGTYSGNAGLTLTAKWTINQYIVTFKDSLNSAWSHPVTVNYGSNATPPTPPSHTGYTFSGWDGSYTNVTSNRTVTATYTINKYYIDVNGSLDGNDISGTSPMGTFDMYINGGLASNDTTDYYQQQNYQTSYEIKDIRANTGYNYTGATGSLSGKVPANSVTVRLNFTTKVYTVSFNANLGEAVSGMPSSVKKTHFKSITLPTNVPTARRYEFLGWSTSPTGSVQYKPGATYSTEGNATLYAIWKLRASIISWYDANGNKHDGLCSIYDSNGNHHYAILYVYDSNGNRHEVI